jgi:hypothetical protein
MTHPRTWWADHGGRVAAAVRGQMIRPATGTTTKHALSETEPTTSTTPALIICSAGTLM